MVIFQKLVLPQFIWQLLYVSAICHTLYFIGLRQCSNCSTENILNSWNIALGSLLQLTCTVYCIVYKYCSRIAAYRRELPRWLAPYSDRRCRQRIPTKSNNSIILNKNTLHTESKCLFASNIAQFSFKPLLVSKKYVFIY